MNLVCWEIGVRFTKIQKFVGFIFLPVAYAQRFHGKAIKNGHDADSSKNSGHAEAIEAQLRREWGMFHIRCSGALAVIGLTKC